MGRDNFVAPTASGSRRPPMPDILGATLAKDQDTGESVEIKSTLAWDYEQLGANAAAAIEHTVAIKKSERRASEAIITAGEHLIAMKGMLNHGQWESWLKTELGMTEPTAWRMMQVAETFGTAKSFKLKDLKASVLYMLASPSTPDEARAAVIEQAANGKVTVEVAKRIIDSHKPAAVFNTAPPMDAPTNGNEHVRYSFDRIVAVATNHVRNGHAAAEAEAPKPMAVHFSSDTPEHYTPQVIIEAAIACMGGIDLDPCSNSEESPNVPAVTHYTKVSDGLAQAWRGCVYMNPPYGREIDDWIGKLVEEYEHGNVTEAIALVPARTDTQWWQRLRNYHVCFITGRLTFVGNNDPAPFPSAVFYLGSNTDCFVNAFEHLGDIWHRTRRGYCFGE